MKLRDILFSLALSTTLISSVRAESIAFVDTSLTLADSTQLGRPFRNEIPQDWIRTELYAGTLDPKDTFYYKTFTYDSSLFTSAPYVEITTLETGNNGFYFFSAYFYRYDPLIQANYWLGDSGFSHAPNAIDGSYFQVVVPTGFDLVLVLNSTLRNGLGLGTAFHFTVDAFADTAYDDPPGYTPPPTDPSTVPEPSTFFTVGTGMIAAALAARRRLRVL